MKTTIELIHEVFGTHTFWNHTQLLRLQKLIQLARADERHNISIEKQGNEWYIMDGQRWYDRLVQRIRAEAWAEGYKQGIDDERTSEANIGIAGGDFKVNPARENPYLARKTP